MQTLNVNIIPFNMGENNNDKIVKIWFHKMNAQISLHTFSHDVTFLSLNCLSSVCVFICACAHVFWNIWESLMLTYITEIYLWLSWYRFFLGKLPEVTNAIFTFMNLHLLAIQYHPVLFVYLCSLWHLSFAVLVHNSDQIALDNLQHFHSIHHL